MAEPMSSNDIEDVLSSIRRLVAQDLKPSDRAKLAAVADGTQKLVLAPENRVEDSSLGASAKFVTVRRPSRRAAFPPVEAVLADVSGQPSPDAGLAPAPSDWALGDTSPAAHAPAFSPEQEEALQSALDAQLAAGKYDAPPAAQFVPVEGQDDFVLVPPGYSVEDAPAYEEELASDAVFLDPNARLSEIDAGSFSASSHDLSTDWQDHEPEVYADLDAKDAETPAQPASLHGTIEPDTAWADAAEARVIAELAGEAVVEEVVAQANPAFREPNFKSSPAAPPEVLFDEDQLRAMVQTIFREEMAGPMGERITRNIRKLVRAEVGRMLAAQELE